MYFRFLALVARMSLWKAFELGEVWVVVLKW